MAMDVLTQIEILKHCNDKMIVLVEAEEWATDSKVGVRIMSKLETGKFIPYYIDHADIDGSKTYFVMHGRNFVSCVSMDAKVDIDSYVQINNMKYVAFDPEEVVKFLKRKSWEYAEKSFNYKRLSEQIKQGATDLVNYMEVAKC